MPEIAVTTSTSAPPDLGFERGGASVALASLVLETVRGKKCRSGDIYDVVVAHGGFPDVTRDVLIRRMREMIASGLLETTSGWWYPAPATGGSSSPREQPREVVSSALREFRIGVPQLASQIAGRLGRDERSVATSLYVALKTSSASSEVVSAVLSWSAERRARGPAATTGTTTPAPRPPSPSPLAVVAPARPSRIAQFRDLIWREPGLTTREISERLGLESTHAGAVARQVADGVPVFRRRGGRGFIREMSWYLPGAPRPVPESEPGTEEGGDAVEGGREAAVSAAVSAGISGESGENGARSRQRGEPAGPPVRTQESTSVAETVGTTLDAIGVPGGALGERLAYLRGLVDGLRGR